MKKGSVRTGAFVAYYYVGVLSLPSYYVERLLTKGASVRCRKTGAFVAYYYVGVGVGVYV